MGTKVDHIGIIVKDFEDSIKKYTAHDILGLKVKEIEEVEREEGHYRLAFIPLGETDIELIHTTAKAGLAADLCLDRFEGIHHIAFEVEDIEAAFQELSSKGVKFIRDKIIDGSRGSRVAFFRPEEFDGVFIELVQR